jgi:hypothetical protein
MTTPVQDPTFQPGASTFGFVIPGMASFGAARLYPQRGVFGTGYFGGEISGVCTEDEVLNFIQGAPVPRVKGPWPVTPDMSDRLRGHWGTRAIFQTRGGEQVIRRMTPYVAAPKDHLTPFWPKFREAVALWKTFPIETRTQLNARASRLGLRYSGYNYFISLYIKDDPARLQYLP